MKKKEVVNRAMYSGCLSCAGKQLCDIIVVERIAINNIAIIE
jgi:hypothetical protein